MTARSENARRRPRWGSFLDLTHWIVLSPSDGLLVAMVGGAAFAVLLNHATSWWEPYADRLTARLIALRREKS
jgi:hypothetical protein